MKKKLTIYFGILGAIVLSLLIFSIIVFCQIYTSKPVITEQDFIAKAKILNTNIRDAEVEISFDKTSADKVSKEESISKYVKKSLLAENEKILLKYLRCADAKTAYSFYLTEYNRYIKSKQDASKNTGNERIGSIQLNGKNYNAMSYDTNFGYFAFIRIDDTYFAIVSPDNDEFKQALNTFEFSNLSHDNLKSKNNGIFIFTFWFVIFTIIYLTIPLAYIFKKAKVHPVIAFIPTVRLYFLCKIADKEGWKMVFLLIPVVNIVYQIIISIKLARVFGKSDLFGVGVYFLPIIFKPIIAFDNLKYIEDSEKKEISVGKFIETMKFLNYKIEDLSDSIRIGGITYIIQANNQDNSVIIKYTKFINEDLARDYSFTLEKTNNNDAYNNILRLGDSVIYSVGNIQNKDEISKIFNKLSETEE